MNILKHIYDLTSSPIALSTALAMMRLANSLMPIEHTPAFLFNEIKRQATYYANTPSGSTVDVHKHFAMSATALQKLTDAPLKDKQWRRHPYASTPDRPAAPFVLIAVLYFHPLFFEISDRSKIDQPVGHK